MKGTALRIIPCLDLDRGRVVKGTRFRDLVDSGDPGELAARYEAGGADEIAILDITATVEGCRTSLEAIRRVRALLSIPLAVGGGIRTAEDAARLLDAGADRVSLNSAALAEPGLIDRLAARYGSQCIVLAIDALARSPGAGGWEVMAEAGRKATGREASAWAREAAGRGAGEILLTSMDRDGTGEGYDLGLLRSLVPCGLPVIASGGARKPRHFLEAAEAGARALLAAGIFHRGEVAIADIKEALRAAGQEVRIC